MCYIMDKDEVITLSSDEESDFGVKVDKTPPKPTNQKESKNSSEIVKCTDNLRKGIISRIAILRHKNKPDKFKDAVAVDRVKKLHGNDDSQGGDSTENCQNHSKQSVIDIDEPLSSVEKSTQGRTNKNNIEINNIIAETGTKTLNSEVIEVVSTSEISGKEESQDKISRKQEFSNQNLQFFTEFVELCGSLEEIETDRVKLTKKLMKRYGEADCHYIKSEEFRSLIQKFRGEVTKNNLYLIAKEVTDELMYRKKTENNAGKTGKPSQRSEESGENLEANERKNKVNKRRARIINKIFEKLDKLGLKIKELEEKEVDLSDEEESTYVQLQRYRERFYRIYTKLSKFTDEITDIDRIYNRRICFTESKYPKINKCIEKWLNKTKRFPDFSDIMKILESQSAELGLPSGREATRDVAREIFEQVGAMLQRKRKHELWDSLCGYLNDQPDPAYGDPVLENVLKKNFENRVKKEQEIFQHYTQLQENQRLEPEEVPDEEANRSPIESGNEDEEEMEKVEELMNKRFDETVMEDSEENDENVTEKEKDNFEKQKREQTSQGEEAKSKESKNNYKNCKSLKWRKEILGEMKSESFTSEDSITEKETEGSGLELIKEGVEESKTENSGDDDSDLELIAIKTSNSDSRGGIFDRIRAETKRLFESPPKRALTNDADLVPGKRVRMNLEEGDFDIFEIHDENDNPKSKRKSDGIDEVIDVYCCQIFTDNVFDDLEERKKDWGKRKVFRDLTNLNRLMEPHGKKRRVSGLFTSSFFHRGPCEFGKTSWKKKFRINFRSAGTWDQKCALNQEKSGKTVNSDSGGDSVEKDVQNNSEGRGDGEGNNFLRGHGNGSEGDNNEDENKKSGRTDVEPNETQHEEEDDEEEEENNAESAEHSLPERKTEEQLENKTPPESADKSDVGEVNVSSETPNDGGKEEREGNNLETENEEESRENEKREEEGPEVVSENHNVESENDNNNVIKNEANQMNEANQNEVQSNESKPEGENSDAENKSTVVTVEEKPNEEVDIIAESDPPHRNSEEESSNKKPPEETSACENKANSGAKISESHRTRASVMPKECESLKPERRRQRECTRSKSATSWKPTAVDSSSQRLRKRTSTTTSDEEIVKRFLLHSPSSISITPPRKLTLSKSPSQAALQALATLRNLKGISATIVRGKPKDDAIGSSYSRRPGQSNQSPARRGRSDFPVISNVQTVTPKIVNVSGNVSGFDNTWPGISNATCDSTPIRISNVWGSLPNNFMQSMVNDTITPGCSSQKSNPGPSNTVKKKNTKKTVEYVVLD